MITCFDNLIGIRGVAGYNNPDLGYFINDLEGLTSQKLEDIAEQEDQYEPRLAWEDIYNRSIRLMESDIKTRMMPYMKNYSEVINDITTELDDNKTLTQSNTYNGWLFDIGTRGVNKELRLEKIGLYLNSAVNFEIKVFDASTGETLNTIGFSGTAGMNEYRLMLTYPLWKFKNIFVAYDASVISTLKTERRSVQLGNVTQGEISNTATVLKASISGSETGMMLNYSYGCSVDNFVCQRVNFFKDPFLYKLGIEYCKEWLYSDRINRWSLLSRDTVMELKDSFSEEYKQMLDQYFRDIKISENDDCFECAKAVMYKQTTP